MYIRKYFVNGQQPAIFALACVQSRAKSNATMQTDQQYRVVTCCLFCVVMVTSKHKTGYQR